MIKRIYDRLRAGQLSSVGFDHQPVLPGLGKDIGKRGRALVGLFAVQIQTIDSRRGEYSLDHRIGELISGAPVQPQKETDCQFWWGSLLDRCDNVGQG